MITTPGKERGKESQKMLCRGDALQAELSEMMRMSYSEKGSWIKGRKDFSRHRDIYSFSNHTNSDC